MTAKILVVTAPDDVGVDGVRVLAVDLTQAQGQVVSNALLRLDNIDANIINYVWHTDNNVPWLLDKKIKSDLIIFNADSPNDLIIGYLAAFSKSFFFGALRDLHVVNNRQINDSEEIEIQLKNILNKHG